MLSCCLVAIYVVVVILVVVCSSLCPPYGFIYIHNDNGLVVPSHVITCELPTQENARELR